MKSIRCEEEVNKRSISGGTHKIGFIIHMAVIKDQQSVLKMAWRPSYETNINKNPHVH